MLELAALCWNRRIAVVVARSIWISRACLRLVPSPGSITSISLPVGCASLESSLTLTENCPSAPADRRIYKDHDALRNQHGDAKVAAAPNTVQTQSNSDTRNRDDRCGAPDQGTAASGGRSPRAVCSWPAEDSRPDVALSDG